MTALLGMMSENRERRKQSHPHERNAGGEPQNTRGLGLSHPRDFAAFLFDRNPTGGNVRRSMELMNVENYLEEQKVGAHLGNVRLSDSPKFSVALYDMYPGGTNPSFNNLPKSRRSTELRTVPKQPAS